MGGEKKLGAKLTLDIPELDKQLLFSPSDTMANEHTKRLLVWDIRVPYPEIFNFKVPTGAPFLAFS